MNYSEAGRYNGMNVISNDDVKGCAKFLRDKIDGVSEVTEVEKNISIKCAKLDAIGSRLNKKLDMLLWEDPRKTLNRISARNNK